MVRESFIASKSIHYRFLNKHVGGNVKNSKKTLRIYPGKSGLTMIGRVSEICQMLDWCSMDERNSN